MIEQLSVRVLRYAIWIGIAGMFILFGSGLVLSGFIPPPSPADSSEEVVRMYAQHKNSIRVGCFLMITGFTFVAVWGGALTALMRRLDGRSPIFSYVQLACVSVVTVIVVFIPMAWAIAAFRAGDISADVTQSISDFGWFLFLYPWPPLMIWLGMAGVAILSDRAEIPLFPRWSGYLCFWTGLLSVPGGMIGFFKTGPFAWDGLLAYWIPLSVFFVWVVGMSMVMFKALDRLEVSVSDAAAHPAAAST